MFCNKCGAPMPEQVRFCSACGNSVEQIPFQQQEQPQYRPQFQPQEQPASFEKPMGRLKFAYTRGGAVSWISFVALLLALALVCVSGYDALYGSVMQWAVVESVEEIPDSPVQELEDALEDGQNVVDECRQLLDELPDEGLTEKEEGYVAFCYELADDLEEMLEEPSMMAIQSMAKQLAENENAFEILEKAEGETDALQFQSEFKDLQDVMSIIVGVIFGCFGLCALLTLLAAALRSNVLTVFGMLGALILCAVVSGSVFVVALLVLYVVAIVLNAVLRKNYKSYRCQL